MNKLLWIDCIGGFFVGLLFLYFADFIAAIDNLDKNLIIFLGISNILYALFSFSLVVRQKRPVSLIVTLGSANIFWFFVCSIFAIINWSQISLIGIVHLFGEGFYVAFIGYLELKYRKILINTPRSK